MARTGAERQHDYRQRHAGRIAMLETEAVGLRRQLETARGDMETAQLEIERLCGELESGPAARCAQCRGELACPRCYRSGDF